MRNIISEKTIIFIVFLSCSLFAQDSEQKYFKNISIEYNTAVVIHNAKLSTEFEFYRNDIVNISLQPGLEYIYSFGIEKTFYMNSPYYDLNVLSTAEFFYDSDISVKPFLGLAYRINSNSAERESNIELKYGGALQVNIHKHFNLIIKSMYVSKQYEEDIPILFGVGFTVVFN